MSGHNPPRKSFGVISRTDTTTPTLTSHSVSIKDSPPLPRPGFNRRSTEYSLLWRLSIVASGVVLSQRIG